MQIENSLKNLKPIQKGGLSKEEAKKRDRKGGLKTAQMRREKASIKQALDLILSSPPTKPIQEALNKAGITMPENANMLEALVQLVTVKATLDNAALGQIIKFLEFFRDTTDGRPLQETKSATSIMDGLFELRELMK